jgi:hypothetical protein
VLGRRHIYIDQLIRFIGSFRVRFTSRGVGRLDSRLGKGGRNRLLDGRRRAGPIDARRGCSRLGIDLWRQDGIFFTFARKRLNRLGRLFSVAFLLDGRRLSPG